MNKSLLVVLLCLAGFGACAYPQVAPYEREDWPVPENGVDVRVFAALRKNNIEPARPCSDEVFIRRVYIDVIGTLPEVSETRQFLDDPRPNKRALLIEALFQREEFADYWALKWGDLLRIKSEFPINLWPNAVQAYHRWVRTAIKENWPYDRFARELLTSSGSNFRVPPVNFYRAVESRDPSAIAEAVARVFMGTRLSLWPQNQRDGFAAFFSRVAYKKTGEWKEEIVYPDLTPTDSVQAMLPDGTKISIPPGEDPRVRFADWLIAPANPWFARNVVNRIWAWLFGRGIIHEPDDIRPDNPPSNPELLAYLEKELINAKYDLRHIYRLILNSRTYQQSPVPRSKSALAESLFAYYPVRRLDAEVLADALDWLGGAGEGYSSPIPEPFTFLPENQRAIGLADGSITSSFLQMFGRPPRDTGLHSERSNQMTDPQRLYLLNSSQVQRRLVRSPRLRSIVTAGQGSISEIIRGMYLTLLCRKPTPAEEAAAVEYWQKSGLSPNDAALDIAWALVNSAEFLYRH
jgi:hypothetical protein